MTAEQQRQILAYVNGYLQDPALFRDYPFPDGPETTVRHVGIFELASETTAPDYLLRLFSRADGTMVGQYRLLQSPEGRAVRLAPGVQFLPGMESRVVLQDRSTVNLRLLKRIRRDVDGYHYAAIVPTDEQNRAMLVALEARPDGRNFDGVSPDLVSLIGHDGALIYSAVAPTPQEKAAEEASRGDEYATRFVDLCVEFGRSAVETSRVRLVALDQAMSNPSSVQFRQTIEAIQSNARVYDVLDAFVTLFQVLSYVQKVAVLLAPANAIANLPTVEEDVSIVLATIVRELIPALEQCLVLDGRRYTVDEMLELLEARKAEIERAAPLLGRLEWSEAANLDPQQLVARIRALVRELKDHNATAAQLMGLSSERIRSGFGRNTILPIPVLHIERIVETVYERELPLMQGDGLYMLAVMQLRANQAMQPWVVGLAQIVFGVFCPPVEVVLGICTAVLSDRDALFREALADADFDPALTLVSRSEARMARFFARLDKVFVMLQLAGPALRAVAAAAKRVSGSTAVQRIADAVRRLPAEEGIPRAVSAADQATSAPGRDAVRVVATAAVDEGRAVRVLDEVVQTAPAESAAASGSAATRRLRAAGADLGNARVSSATTVEEALQDMSAATRRRLGEHVEEIEASYREYFQARRSAIAQGSPLPEPRPFEHYAIDEFRSVPRPRSGDLRRAWAGRPGTLLEWLAGSRGKAMLEEAVDVLDDLPQLRERFRALLKQRGLARTRQAFTAGENALVDEVQALIRAGATTEQIDEAIRHGLVDPLRAAAGGNATDLAWAVFQHIHGGRLAGWRPDSLEALRGLFATEELRTALNAIVGNRNFAGMTEEIIRTLGRGRTIPGVLLPLGDAESLIQRLISSPTNRSIAWEATLVNRIVERVPGAKILVGKRFESSWLGTAIEHVGGRAQQIPANLIEGDLTVFLPNGRRVMLEAKWVGGGWGNVRDRILRAMRNKIAFQLYKAAHAVNDGLIDEAVIVLSHNVVDDVLDVPSLQRLIARLPSDRIRIVGGAFDDASQLTRQLEEAGLGRMAGLTPAPVVPAAVVAGGAEGARAFRTLPDVLDVPGAFDTVSLVGRTRGFRILLRPAAGDDRAHAVRVVPHRDSSPLVRDFGVYEALRLGIGARSTQEMIRSGLTEADLESCRVALADGRSFRRAPVPEHAGGHAAFHQGETLLVLIAWRCPTPTPGTRWEVRGYAGRGRVGMEMTPRAVLTGWNCIPLVAGGSGAVLPPDEVVSFVLLLTGTTEAALSLRVMGTSTELGSARQ